MILQVSGETLILVHYYMIFLYNQVKQRKAALQAELDQLTEMEFDLWTCRDVILEDDEDKIREWDLLIGTRGLEDKEDGDDEEEKKEKQQTDDDEEEKKKEGPKDEGATQE